MNKPRPQELYRHFKGNLYQIISVAIHSETGEEMVVYQALYGDFKVYVRPLDMFMSKVDRDKYPDVKQEYRFERVDATELASDKPQTSSAVRPQTSSAVRPQTSSAVRPQTSSAVRPQTSSTVRPQTSSAVRPDRPAVDDQAARRKPSGDEIQQERERFRQAPYQHSTVMDKSVSEEADELNLDPLVIEFMDADLAVDKNDILSKLRPTITNDMIDIMAMSLGVVVNDGDVYDRFNDLRTCLNTMEKFESTRLR